MSAVIDRKLQQAAAALAAGDPGGAERLSRQVLERAPRHPRALQLAASARLQQGDGAGAGALLQRALAADPNNPQILEGLGAAALRAGDPAAAESWLRRAVALGRSGADTLSWLGMALSGQGRRAEAAEAFRMAAVKAPQDPGMHLNLGNELMLSGEWEDAAASYGRALRLRADYPEALNGLGLALKAQGRIGEAAARFREAIALKPDYAEAHDNLGDACLRLGQYAEAEAAFRQALALAPGNADYRAGLGMALGKQDRWREAIAEYQRALALRPDYPEALNSIGSALIESGDPAAALAPIRQAIALKPDYAEARENLGSALLRLGREAEADASYREALRLHPEQADLHFRYGCALKEQQRWDEAIAEFEQAIALDPAHADAHYSLSFVRLFRHEFDKGWAGQERRYETAEYRKRSFRKAAASVALFERLPRWRGPAEAVEGEVAIWAEQGIGDQLLFSTLLPELIATGVPFLYEVDRRLLAAYQRAFPGARFVPWEEPPLEPLQRASRVLGVGSLPRFFRRARADFAHQPERLLGALPERTAFYRRRLDALGAGPKIALCWRSTRQDWWGQRKNARLADFAPLLELPGARFVDVQYGDTAAERGALDAAAQLARFEDVDLMNDLESVFAILEACDLVITTSNATAHFAGVLGKRAWLLYLSDRAPFFYWAHGGSHRCLWYPSVEILTAPHFTDWASLIGHVRQRLERETAAGALG